MKDGCTTLVAVRKQINCVCEQNESLRIPYN